MSQAEAMARARVLRESLLDHGVRKVSIELVEGRTVGWSDDRFVATLGHHIVSRRSQGLTPFLSLVKKGRADLPGPICNGYGGFDEVARIICMGWANHSGRGGPVTVEAGTIPRNNGRPYLFGWEFEGGLDPADWPDSFHQFMGRCHAGTLDWLGRTEKSHHEHKTWAPGRKSDRLGYSLATARAEAERYLGDNMADHQHAPMPDELPRKWADDSWDEYAEHSDTNDNTRGYTMYREDISWVWQRLIKPLEASVARLEKEVDELKAQGESSGGDVYGTVVKLTKP